MKKRGSWSLIGFCISVALVVICLAMLGADQGVRPSIVIVALLACISAFLSGRFLTRVNEEPSKVSDLEGDGSGPRQKNLEVYLESAMSPCLIIDQNRRVLASNDILENLWGISKARLKEAHITFNDHSSEDDVWDIETSTVELGTSVYLSGELCLRREVKSLGVFHFTWVAYPDKNSRAIFIEIAEPSSQDKLVENRRIEMIEALRLRDDDRSLLKELNHSLRTELQGLLGMIELLRGDPKPKQQTRYLDALEHSTENVLDRVDTFIDLFEVDAYSGQTADVYSIDQLLSGISQTLNSRSDTDTFEVLYDTDRSVFRNIKFPREVLEKLIGHLVAHIVQARNDGWIVVKPRILDSCDQAPELSIEVVQRSKAQLQGQGSSIHDPDKISLDLEIARRLAGAVKGELQVGRFSGDNPGFKFRIRGVVTDDLGSGFVVPSYLKNLRTLIIDDNPVSREVLQELAHEIGWHADVAASGESALHMMKFKSGLHTPYDIVLVDWRMPDADGWETSQKIRDELEDGQMPIIVMISAHNHEFLSKDAIERSKVINGFLTKPVTLSMLLDAVIDATMHQYEPDANEAESNKSNGKIDSIAGKKVLVVDDNTMNLEVAKELLSLYGATVITASGGYSAITTVQNAGRVLDMVLMDINMPDLDGLSAVTKIRALGYTQLPIVMMTANTSDEIRTACFKAGAQDIVQKPFLAREIAETLAETIRKGADVELDKGFVNLSERTLSVAAELDIDLESAIGRFDGSLVSFSRALENLILELLRVRGHLTENLPGQQPGDLARELRALGGMLGLIGIGAGSGSAKSLAQKFAFLNENRPDFLSLKDDVSSFLGELDHTSQVAKVLNSYIATELGSRSDKETV